ncbi:hypothetical protein [Williamsia deligens]|uniref:Uncharacterized protein n=1 Tax=Williamsia deligens TaxID=321325 RepID=A0ABW3GBZ9_9NOCA|nr:hypothetical protein [Williamsia deligens]MCP2193002.1 hypothetical protein [Williamsia deligens]
MAAISPRDTSHSSTSVRIWRIVAMLAPLVGLVIGMLLVMGSMG